MTTIAYDGNIIAADGQVTGGSIIKGLDCMKLRLFKRGRTEGVIAYAGDLAGKLPFENWVSLKEHSRANWEEAGLSELDFEALVLYKGDCLHYESMRLPIECTGVQALGSGVELAMAAMKCGKNAIEAVEIASQLDIYTGGKITAYKRDGSKWILID